MTDPATRPKVLAVTGGHSFDRDAFGALLDALPATVTWVEHPEARAWMDPERLAGFDCSLHYDLPGLRPEPTAPPAAYVAGVEALTAAGHGFVILHHALAAWPRWEGWAELAGGRFHYGPGRLRGRDWPDSGYRMDVPQHLRALDPAHPVLAGLADGLDLVDETYVCPVFEDEVTPLLATNASTSARNHWSTAAAMAGQRGTNEGWDHPDGSALAAWTRIVDRSRVVFVQPGDGPATFAHEGYRRLLGNALAWVATPDR